MKKRLILIGNAQIQMRFLFFSKKKSREYSQFVDSADKVIRINSASNYNLGTGQKTDILALINIGVPAVEFSYLKKIELNVVSQINSVWFTRPKEGIPSKYQCGFPSILLADMSNHIINFQGLSNSSMKYISFKQYENLLIESNKGNKGEKKYQPSSGFCVLRMILEEEQYEFYDKYVLGFTWQGWSGHNWEYERKWFHALEEKGRIKILK